MEKDYYQDGLARVLDLMKDTFGFDGPIKGYFNGEPEDIPISLLPAIIVTETDGTIETDATQTDLITENILIIVAMNRMDDIGGSKDTDLTDFKIRKLVKGQDPDTRQYLPQTVMYAIRKHITMGNEILYSAVRTRFNVTELRGADTVTQEGYVELTIKRRIQVPQRD